MSSRNGHGISLGAASYASTLQGTLPTRLTDQSEKGCRQTLLVLEGDAAGNLLPFLIQLLTTIFTPPSSNWLQQESP
eukprot:1160716-Pelagomonas_calceolata.AAC.1